MKPAKPFITKIAGLMAVALALFAAGLFLVTRDDAPAAKLLRQGNDAFAAENYLDALGAYELAQSRQPELAEPFYNAANALYRQGSFADAMAQIQQALLNAQEDELAQHSFYNMGNAAYNSQDLETAVQAYTKALLINPNDADAKYNLELALQQQEQNQQEQEQNQQEQKQDQQEQDSEQSENENNQNENNQNGAQNDQQQEPNADNGQNDQQSEKGSGDQESEQPQDGQGQENKTDSESNQDAPESSQNNENKPDQQTQNQPGQGDGQPSEEQPNQPPSNGMVPQPGERLTAEQARQLLMAIAQGSGTLQERLQQIYVSPLPPSGQDW